MNWSPPDRRSLQAVETDPWDQRDHKRATKGFRPYSSARKTLAEATPTGEAALADTFAVLNKANPWVLPASEMAPTHLVNRLVAAEMLQLPSTRRLRRHTVGDPVQAALGCVSLAPLLETVFERLSLEQAAAQELQEQLVAVEALAAEMADAEREFDGVVGEDPSDEDVDAALERARHLRDLRQRIADARAALDQAMAALQQRLRDEAASVRSSLRAAVGPVANDVEEQAATARAWGLDPGQLQRLSPSERLRLAQKLAGPKMREIAELFGRIRNLAFADAERDTEGTWDEIVDLELGGDLDRVVPSERLLLGEPDTEMDFLARWADGELLQYAVAGSNELGRGGIVMCIDGSGSMYGAPEKWAKAVMLVLLHEARAQGREMHVIHFGGPGQSKVFSFTSPSDFNADRIMDAAGAYFGGGTDFETPMKVALEVLGDEFGRTGRTRADVVFVTDDECYVEESFMTHYLAEMRRMGARTYGLEMRGVAPVPGGALMAMCEERVASISDLQSGKDVRATLRAVRGSR